MPRWYRAALLGKAGGQSGTGVYRHGQHSCAGCHGSRRCVLPVVRRAVRLRRYRRRPYRAPGARWHRPRPADARFAIASGAQGDNVPPEDTRDRIVDGVRQPYRYRTTEFYGSVERSLAEPGLAQGSVGARQPAWGSHRGRRRPASAAHPLRCLLRRLHAGGVVLVLAPCIPDRRRPAVRPTGLLPLDQPALRHCPALLPPTPTGGAAVAVGLASIARMAPCTPRCGKRPCGGRGL